ncbi:TPA: DUF4393 domain-containing protein [Vibrio parahaemolyticus]|nr:DUF4393 domain-containing protein [Vibrio parahaemolyticus]
MEDVIEKTAKELGLKDLVPEIYKDLLQPAVREVGSGLVKVAKAVCIATAPFEMTVWGYDRMKELLVTTLTRKLSSQPPENIVAPELHIAGPILTNYAFVSQKRELRELYENLLASSMLKNKKCKVHPSFSHIVLQLSPDEALLLKSVEGFEEGWLCSEYSDASDGTLHTKTIRQQFSEICSKSGLIETELFDSYLENMVRLGILNRETYGESDLVLKGDDQRGYRNEVNHTLQVAVSISPLGYNLIDACVAENCA